MSITFGYGGQLELKGKAVEKVGTPMKPDKKKEGFGYFISCMGIPSTPIGITKVPKWELDFAKKRYLRLGGKQSEIDLFLAGKEECVKRIRPTKRKKRRVFTKLKKVCCLNDKGEILHIYNSYNEAVEKTGISYLRVAVSEKKMARGFYWSKLEDLSQYQIEKFNKRS